MKSVKEKLPEDRVAAFEKNAQAFAKKLVGGFKDYEFVGHSQLFFSITGSNVSRSSSANP